MERGQAARTRGALTGVFVALLRGVNVDGVNRLPMATLADIFSCAAALARLDPRRSRPDEFVVAGSKIYLRPSTA